MRDLQDSDGYLGIPESHPSRVWQMLFMAEKWAGQVRGVQEPLPVSDAELLVSYIS